MRLIASGFNSRHLSFKGYFVRDMSAEFTHQDTELSFSHIQPACVLWRVVKDDTPGNAVGLGRSKGFVERRELMDVEIVTNQIDPVGIGITDINEPTHLTRKVLSSALV